MKWLLIIWLNTSHGVTPFTMSFAREDLCHATKTVLINDLTGFNKYYVNQQVPARCLPTGIE